MSTTPFTGVRLSSLPRCTRQAFYQGVGQEQEPLDDEAMGYMERGEVMGAWFAATHHPDAEHEVEVEWEHGVGHIDVLYPERPHIVEHKSAADCSLEESNALQAAGYALSHGPGTTAEVTVTDPSNWRRQETIPVNVEGLRPEWERRVAELGQALATGVAPERVCRHPQDFASRFCPFAGECFSDWRRPELGELIGVEDDFRRLADLATTLKAEPWNDAAKTEQGEVRDRLRAYIESGEQYLEGGVLVKRTTFERTTLALGNARKAGFDIPEHLAPFVSTSPQERWTVKVVEE